MIDDKQRMEDRMEKMQQELDDERHGSATRRRSRSADNVVVNKLSDLQAEVRRATKNVQKEIASLAPGHAAKLKPLILLPARSYENDQRIKKWEQKLQQNLLARTGDEGPVLWQQYTEKRDAGIALIKSASAADRDSCKYIAGREMIPPGIARRANL